MRLVKQVKLYGVFQYSSKTLFGVTQVESYPIWALLTRTKGEEPEIRGLRSVSQKKQEGFPSMGARKPNSRLLLEL
jgi:hypothetical protein